MFCRKIYKTLQLPRNIITPVWIKHPLNYSYRQNSGLCLENKVVIVTGGGAGIGAATVIAFAKERAKVVIADFNEENLLKMTKHCQEKLCAEALGFHCDVTNEGQVKAMVCDTIAKFGQIDVLVNNAGILNFGSLLKGDIMESYDKALAINLRACIYLSMLAAPYLVKTKGNIVNLSSILGIMYSGESTFMPYCISKAGLDNFMYGAALELSPHGVRVNNVCPGSVKTEIFSKAGVKGSWEDISQSLKIKKLLEPEEIADLILYLASYKARSITGARYYIDNWDLIHR